MADPRLEEMRRGLAPVPPRDAFARSLLERLERELAGATTMSDDEIDAQLGEELPLREAMSVMSPDPIGPLDLGAVLGNVEPGTQPDQPA